MQHVGPMLYGKFRATAYCSMSYLTHVCLKHSDGAALWIAIFTQEMLLKLTGQPRTKAIALQRASGKRALISALQNREKNFQSAFLMILKALQVYLVFGDIKSQSVHSAAADMLIDSVGGLESALNLSGDIEPHFFAALFTFTSPTIKTRTLLEQICSRFLNIIQLILRLVRPGHVQTFRGQISHLIARGDLPIRYLDVEADTISMFDSFVTVLPTDSQFLRKFRIVLLTHLCCIYLDFESNPDAILETFQCIKYHYTNIFIGAGDGDQVVLALGASVAHVRREMLKKYVPDKQLGFEFRDTQMAIDAAKLFNHMNRHIQEQIMTRLRDWFVEHSVEAPPLTTDEVNAIRADVVGNWSATRRNAKDVDGAG
jgi:hypothetical protein